MPGIGKPMRAGEAGLIAGLYSEFRKTVKTTIGEAAGTHITVELVSASLLHLANRCERTELRSRVSRKRYFALRDLLMPGRISRPVNADLLIDDPDEVIHLLRAVQVDPLMTGLSAHECNRLLYTASMSFCAVCDITATGDKKTPEEYFELLVGHILSLAFGAKPRTNLDVLTVEDERLTLPTGFIFDLGPKNLKFHVPVRISTGKGVIEVWAYQKMLDGACGEGRFRGVLVSLSETKLDPAALEVTEICMPEQWAVYQRFIARMDRVYYLDLPLQYAALANQFPFIPVKTFGEFFKEKDQLVRPHAP